VLIVTITAISAPPTHNAETSYPRKTKEAKQREEPNDKQRRTHRIRREGERDRGQCLEAGMDQSDKGAKKNQEPGSPGALF